MVVFSLSVFVLLDPAEDYSALLVIVDHVIRFVELHILFPAHIHSWFCMCIDYSPEHCIAYTVTIEPKYHHSRTWVLSARHMKVSPNFLIR